MTNPPKSNEAALAAFIAGKVEIDAGQVKSPGSPPRVTHCPATVANPSPGKNRRGMRRTLSPDQPLDDSE